MPSTPSQHPNPNPNSRSKPPALLPQGTSSTFRGLSENFSFHASPESFITSRINQLQSQDPELLERRVPIRAKVLNRNVAVVSSYRHVQFILGSEGCSSSSNGNGDNDARGGRVGEGDADDDGGDCDDQDPAFVAGPAYNDLMSEFFPPPNLLLADGCPHRTMRGGWDERMRLFNECIGLDKGIAAGESSVLRIIRAFFEDRSCVPLSEPVDLYETMKALSWKILLGVFLGLSREVEDGDGEAKLFTEVQMLHEDLLRGQFSLFPVSINAAGWWRSPRSKGIQARKKLQELIAERIGELRDRGPTGSKNGECFLSILKEDSNVGLEEVRDHVLMMTSSLAVKGLASLLTALFLNLFLSEKDGMRGFEQLRGILEDGQSELRRHITSVYLETERLSPPIVGVMRRVTRDMILDGDDGQPDTLLPRGWDAWLYFVGAGRDPSIFGDTYMDFDQARYLSENIPESLGFGAGSKSCLGKHLVRNISLLVAEHCVRSKICVEGEVWTQGLRGWLGWQVATPDQWATDIKQLPTQHPKKPVMVKFVQR